MKHDQVKYNRYLNVTSFPSHVLSVWNPRQNPTCSPLSFFFIPRYLKYPQVGSAGVLAHKAEREDCICGLAVDGNCLASKLFCVFCLSLSWRHWRGWDEGGVVKASSISPNISFMSASNKCRLCCPILLPLSSNLWIGLGGLFGLAVAIPRSCFKEPGFDTGPES